MNCRFRLVAFGGAVACVVVGLAGCGGGGKSTPAAKATNTSTTPQEQFATVLTSRLGPHGEIDPALAADVLTTFFGAKAGGHALPGAGALFDGTLAHDVAAAAWPKMNAAQKATVRDLLAVRSAGGRGKARALTPTPAAPADVARANSVATQIAGHLGHRLGVPLTVVSEPDSPYPPTTIADTTARDASGEDAFISGGAMSECYVRLFPSYFTGPGSDVAMVLAHELFHCFQDTRIYCGGCSHTPPPLWVAEGEAEWAGADIAPGAAQPYSWWRLWLRNSTAPLERRSYDAVGFYAAAAQRGHDPWTFMLDLLTIPATDMSRAYLRATGVADASFMAAVGAFDQRARALGALWNATGPSIPPADPLAVRDLGPGATTTMHETVDPFGAFGDVFNVHADVFSIASGAEATAVGFAGGPTHVFSDPATHTFCIAGDACLCPDGSPVEGGMTIVHDEGGIVGVAVGSTSAAEPTVTLVSHQLDRSHCPTGTTVAAGPVPPCAVGSWRLTRQEITLSAAANAVAALHIVGRDNGKRMQIAASGAFTLTDDGSDPTTQNSSTSGITVSTTVVVSGRVSGTASGTPTRIDFDGRDVDVTIAVHGTAAGTPFNSTQHYTTANSAGFFGVGSAAVQCTGTTLTLTFANATFTYAKA